MKFNVKNNKIFHLLFFLLLLSVIINLFLLSIVTDDTEYEKSIWGYYQVKDSNTQINFHKKENTVEIVNYYDNRYNYESFKLNKLQKNMYYFDYDEEPAFIFRYDDSFNIFLSDRKILLKLEKLADFTLKVKNPVD